MNHLDGKIIRLRYGCIIKISKRVYACIQNVIKNNIDHGSQITICRSLVYRLPLKKRKGSIKTPREMAPRLPFLLRDELRGKLA